MEMHMLRKNYYLTIKKLSKMKKIIFLSFFSALFIFQSCNEDLGKLEVTYTKATALYGDLETIRQTPLRAEARTIENPGKIFVANDLLLIGEENKGIHVINNSDPANPVEAYFINIPGNKEYYVEEGIIFAESYYDMVKIDVTNPDNPVLLGRIELAFSDELKNAEGETLIGFDFEVVTEELENADDFWININPNDVLYYDYTQTLIPESAVPASFAGNSENGIGSVNRIAFYNDHVYTISNSIISVFTGAGEFEKLNNFNIGWQMETIFPHDNKLFIGTRNSMDVYDISTPAEPMRLSSFWHATSCDPVYPTDEVAYVTLRTGDFSNCPGDVNALIVLDITDISFPHELQEIEMKSPFGMTLFNDKLFVGEGENGLKIFDASNRRNLQLESWDNSIQAYDVIQHPSRTDLVLIAGPNGLGQYELEGGSGLGLVSFMNF
jgi:hypothetical protein